MTAVRGVILSIRIQLKILVQEVTIYRIFINKKMGRLWEVPLSLSNSKNKIGFTHIKINS
jgi:hypothetical protein